MFPVAPLVKAMKKELLFNNLSTHRVPTAKKKKRYLTHSQEVLPIVLISVSLLDCERDALQPDVHRPQEAPLALLLDLNPTTHQKPPKILQGLDLSAHRRVRDHPLQINSPRGYCYREPECTQMHPQG